MSVYIKYELKGVEFFYSLEERLAFFACANVVVVICLELLDKFF